MGRGEGRGEGREGGGRRLLVSVFQLYDVRSLSDMFFYEGPDIIFKVRYIEHKNSDTLVKFCGVVSNVHFLDPGFASDDEIPQ